MTPEWPGSTGATAARTVRLLAVGEAAGDVDLHALALTLRAPALVERGDAPRERWHVIPLVERARLRARAGRGSIEWTHGADRAQIEGRGLDMLRSLAHAVATPRPDEDVPFAGGLVLMLGYGLRHEIERLPDTTEDRDGLPWVVAVACAASLVVPVGGGTAWLAWWEDGDDGGRFGLAPREAEDLARECGRALASGGGGAVSPHGRAAGAVRALWTREDHEAGVRTILEDLRAGEIYQANLTQRFEVPWEGSALPLHAILRRSNPSPFSGWLLDEGFDLISGSPERLVRLVGTALVTEPIAGTVPLPHGADTPARDVAALAERLGASAKDHAEHVMIVDLHRNDLGRVSAPGSVHVAEMMRLDRRSHVVQAIADIRGTLAAGKDAIDVIEATFPGGCVTGVPKIRAMEILDGLERFSRGPYTGSFGLLAPWGDLDLNVLIRSAWRVGNRLAFSAGGGIVLDSDPSREYDESLAKAAALREAVEASRA